MTQQEEKAAMAVRDLMSALSALAELPNELVAVEREDIELAHQRLIKLLIRTEMEMQHG